MWWKKTLWFCRLHIWSYVHSSIIRKDNFYKYDYSLTNRFNTQLISLVKFKIEIMIHCADTCYTLPKKINIFLQAQKEAKKDFWESSYQWIIKTKNIVNVIKPISRGFCYIP